MCSNCFCVYLGPKSIIKLVMMKLQKFVQFLEGSRKPPNSAFLKIFKKLRFWKTSRFFMKPEHTASYTQTITKSHVNVENWVLVEFGWYEVTWWVFGWKKSWCHRESNLPKNQWASIWKFFLTKNITQSKGMSLEKFRQKNIVFSSRTSKNAKIHKYATNCIFVKIICDF